MVFLELSRIIMCMMRTRFLPAGIFLVVFALSLTPAEAASKKPSVKVLAPEKNEQFARNGQMPVFLELKNVDRPMVVEITMKLLKQDRSGFPVGFASGSGYQFTVYEGQTEYEFVVDWGLNDTIPGKYSITAQLKACNSFSCDHAPASKALSKKSKPVNFTLVNTTGWSSTVNPYSGTQVTLLAPNGGEKYYAGSGAPLKLSWVAEGVPSGSKVQTLLIQKSTGQIFAFPGTNKQKKAKDGKDSVTGKLTRTAGYDLAPGEYWAKVTIMTPDPKTGKDAPTLAEDISDRTFTLRPLSGY
jgi:hypothetical protein